MNKPTLIFDFDGTISDSFDSVIEVFNDMSEKFHFEKIDKEKMPELKKVPSEELFRRFRIPAFRLPFAIRDAKKRLNKKIPFIPIIPGIDVALRQLKEKEYILGIITSNSTENVVEFLKKNELEVFNFICSGNNVFGKDRLIKKTIKNYGLPQDRTLYVGDETRDIVASKKAGIPIIAVSWGFAYRETLAAYKPDYLLDKPEELVLTIEAIVRNTFDNV